MANRCYLCVEEETFHHILLHCDKTRVVRHLLFSLFGMAWVIPYTVKELLCSWYESFVGREAKSVANGSLMSFLDFGQFEWK